MKKVYRKIIGSYYRHIYVVGDLHGQYDKLKEELAKVDFDFKQDLLISVGDLVDRGSQNIKCLELLNKSWFKCVLGNHDLMMINYVLSPSMSNGQDWFSNGGNWYHKLSEEEQLKVNDLVKNKLMSRPYVLEVNTNGKIIVITHACYPRDRYQFGQHLDEFDLDLMVWDRAMLESQTDFEVKGADAFYHGHTPLDKPATFGNRHYIDTGAFMAQGYLTLVKIQ